MSIILDAMQMLFNPKPKEGETLQDYTKRYKTAREMFCVSTLVLLTKYVTTMKEDGKIPRQD
jgi:hypothetical protein